MDRGPIDGTHNFVRGVPVWATLIALVVAEEEPVMGLVAAPALGRRWWKPRAAERMPGGASRRQHTDPHVRCPATGGRGISLSSVTSWDALGRTDAGARISPATAGGSVQTWRLLVLHAAGRGVRRHRRRTRTRSTTPALAPIVTEASGAGSPLDGTDGVFGSNALATNGHLHDHVLERIRTVSRLSACQRPGGRPSSDDAPVAPTELILPVNR